MTLSLKGIIPPVITPLINNRELDTKGLTQLIRHLIDGGVHGLFILGTTGEAPGLGYKIRKELIKRVCDEVDHQIPVLVGVTDTSFENTLSIAEYAREQGADAAVIAPPYYFPISDREMMVYIEHLSDALPLPFVMYNMPSHTKMHLSLSVVERCRELGALGIKDSSGDAAYCYSLIDKFKDYPEFSVITGTELYLPETVLYGGHGAIAGGANIFPKLFVALYNAAVNHNLETINTLREQLIKIENTIYNVDSNPSRYIKSIKCAVSALGICSDYVVHPHRKFTGQQRQQIEIAVKTLLDELN